MSVKSKARGPRPWKRGGLHKLACHDCKTYAYAAVAQIERHGLIACPADDCGREMVPDELELALHLGLNELPIVREYERVHAGKEASQRRSLGWNEAAARHSAGSLASMELAAIDDMRRERWEACRSNRLQALKPAATPMPF
jgi:hypothetical protein